MARKLRKLWAWAITITALPFAIIAVVLRLLNLVIKAFIEYWFWYCGPRATKEEGKSLSNPVSRWMADVLSY